MSKTQAAEIMARADTLAKFSASARGLTRAYLTPSHRQAHDQLASWMNSAGLSTWQDSVGNQWGRKVAANPSLPPLVIGSHSDTVVNAGKYDGNLGVLLGIAAAELLKDVELPFHLDIVAFADEEGTRFNTTLIGSSATAGCFDPAWLKVEDSDGTSMTQAMQEFGLDPAAAGQDSRQDDKPMGYLEVHIEQGPVLESHDLPVGVVTAIAGAKRYQFRLRGMAGHAGTVPLELRQDALCGAAEMISTIEAYAKAHELVATVGRCEVKSAMVNVIPGEVRFTLDIRSPSQQALEQGCTELLDELNTIAQQRALTLEGVLFYQAEAVSCDENLKQLWAGIAERQTGQPTCLLPSGAGHDAMVMARIAPMAMLFVRCDKGISHHPAEQVQEADVAVALDCLVEMVGELTIARSE